MKSIDEGIVHIDMAEDHNTHIGVIIPFLGLSRVHHDFSFGKMRILIAHSTGERGFYFVHYPEGKRKVEMVQDWVNRFDESYNALGILCCNTYNDDLTSRHARLVYPNGDVNGRELIFSRNERFRVEDPVIERTYLIDKLKNLLYIS